jgi:hypothetical protein
MVESNIELGSGKLISRDQKMKDSSIFSSDLRSDSIDGLTIPFRNMGDGCENTCGQKCSLAYKLSHPHPMEKKGHTHKQLLTYLQNEPFDIYEYLFGTYTCCGPHVFNLFNKRLTPNRTTLDDWNLECVDYGYNDGEKCTHFPRYCEKMIKDVVMLLSGYISHNWNILQADLKGLYWQHDRPKNTTAALHQLVHDAQTGKIDLNVFVL